MHTEYTGDKSLSKRVFSQLNLVDERTKRRILKKQAQYWILKRGREYKILYITILINPKINYSIKIQRNEETTQKLSPSTNLIFSIFPTFAQPILLQNTIMFTHIIFCSLISHYGGVSSR